MQENEPFDPPAAAAPAAEAPSAGASEAKPESPESPAAASAVEGVPAVTPPAEVDAAPHAPASSANQVNQATQAQAPAAPKPARRSRDGVRSPSQSDSALDGTGEGPPPGTRFEGIVVSLIALAMISFPVLASLRRVSLVAKEHRHFHWLGSALQFFLPNDMSWGSVYVQNATLWIGFLGAILAAAGGKHLGLSTTNFMSRSKLRDVCETLTTTVMVVVSWVLAYASARMVAADRVGGDSDLLPGGIPKWTVEVIMPLGFAMIAARAVWRATDPVARYSGPHGAGSSSSHIPVMPLTPRRRILRIILFVLVAAVAAAAVYLGFAYDKSDRIQAAIGRLDAFRGTIKTVGLLGIGAAFLLGVPVFIVMAGTAMTLFFAGDTPVASLPTETFRLVANPSLPAIPLLTFAGYVLASGRSSQRLVRAYKSLFGWMPGGMAVMVVAVCGLFTTFTGASGVTILALGGLVYPMLVKDRYPSGFSLGLVTAAGSLGLLFPPSLPVILYAVAASAPGSVAPVGVEQLYIGGLLPGLVLVLLVSLYGIRMGVKAKAPRQAFEGSEVKSALWAAKWDLLLPVVVVVAFGSGVATIVEAAAIGAAYALAVELIIFRDVHPWRTLPGVLAHGAALVGAVVLLLGVAMGLTNYLVVAEVPAHLVDWVQTHIHSQAMFLLALNVMLLILGSVLEIYSAIVVLVPLVAPLGVAFNVHPVHLGVIFLANLELGFLCPPMGLNLFLSATRFQKPLPVLYRQALPFLFIMSVGVLFITYVESATVGLLRVLGKQ
jgi:tripartite ATP-independent transporter DctM subunit